MEKNNIDRAKNQDNAMFLSIFENSINAILFGIPDGTLLDANPAAVEMFGYSLEELRVLGRGVIFDSSDPKMIASLKIREQTGKAKGELIGIRKNGEHFPCEFSSAIFITETGERRTSTVLNDITERKKAEHEIALLMDNTEESFVLIDRNLKIISFNKQFKERNKLFLKKDASKGDFILDFVKEERKEIVKNNYKKVFSGETFEDEIIFSLEDKEQFIFSIRYKPAIDDKGDVIGIFITLRDITAKRKAQQQIIINEKRFRSIVEHTGDLITLADINGKFIYVSPSVEKVIGFSLYEVVNKSHNFTVHPDYIEEGELVFEELLKKPGIPIPRLTKILHKDGHYIWIEGIITNLLHDENVKAIVSNYRDITEKIESNRQKEFEKSDKEALINSTDDLIWSVSTDFKLFAGNNAFINFLKNVVGVTLVPGDNILEMEFFSAEVLAFWKTLYEKGFAGNCFKQEIYTREFENTPQAWAELSITPIYNSDKIVGVACYSRNTTEKRIAQIKLNERNELFEILTSKIPAAIYQFEMRPDGKIRFPYFSEGIEKINPKLNVELLKEDATSAFESVHPDDLQKLLVSIEVSKNSLTDWVFEYRSIVGKGEIIWTRGMSSPEKMEDGTVVWYGYLQDITEQKNSNEKIRISNERYYIIAKATNDTIWDTDLLTHKVKWNKGIVEIFGYTETEPTMNIDWWYSKIHPDDIKRVQKNLVFRINNCAPRWEDEYRFCCADGSYKFVHDRGFLVINDNIPVRMIGSMQDITERKKVEAKYKESEKRFRTIFEAGPECVKLIDSSGELIEMNSAGLVIFEADSFEQIKSHGLAQFILPKYQADIEVLYQNSLKGEKGSLEFEIMGLKGTVRWLETNLVPMKDTGNQITMLLAVTRDITQRKNYELEREQIIAELSQNNKDLKQFSYVTSHNLRAPIANLLGLSNLLDNYKIPDKSLKQILNGIKQSALMFDDTVKDLSNVLIIKDQSNIVTQEFSLVTIVDKTLKQLGVIVYDNEVKIICEFENAPTVIFTSSYLESIFINLFTNALKYKSNKRELKINISSEDTKEFVIVRFKDNGIGIDIERHREKLFKLYQRFHDNSDGKGLGLYLVKSQMEALGGSIEVESIVEKETVFILKFKKNIGNIPL